MPRNRNLEPISTTHHPETGEHLEAERLTISRGNTTLEVSTHGAVATSLTFNGIEILFPGHFATPKEPDSAPSWGNLHLCFPMIGIAAGPYDQLPKHGFAERVLWQVIKHTKTSITLQLKGENTPAAKYGYPENSELQITYQIETDGSLTTTLQITNTGTEEPLPVAPGFHPYFTNPSGNLGDIIISGENLGNATFDDLIEVLGNTAKMEAQTTRATVGQDRTIIVTPIEGFNGKDAQTWFWTNDSKRFCVELTAAGAPALGIEDTQINVAPGDTALFSLNIACHITPSRV